ncbi:MAG TPA: hypothetical protein VMY87_10640 [Armatimonadota bacterium]|nr:hypothetical protein [Armatimonadota bacterium]
MSEVSMRKLDRTSLGTAQRVGMWSAVVWSLAALAALGAGPGRALGLAVGGGITLGFFALHLALARQWIAPARRRSARIYLWFVWLVKWPASGTLLYLALTSGYADPVWLCLGAGIVPLVATVFALQMLLRGRARRPILEGAS